MSLCIILSNDYGMYQMTYYGDYGFDDFLETGAENDADIEAFVTKRLLKGLPINLGVTGDGMVRLTSGNHQKVNHLVNCPRNILQKKG